MPASTKRSLEFFQNGADSPRIASNAQERCGRLWRFDAHYGLQLLVADPWGCQIGMGGGSELAKRHLVASAIESDPVHKKAHHIQSFL